MEKNKMKNIVVLKNLPSNLIEEAIVIFKSRNSAKEFEYIDKTNKKNNNSNKNPNEFIIKEAENVILNCVSNNDKNNKKEKDKKGLNKKYKRLKVYSVVVSLLLVLTFIIH